MSRGEANAVNWSGWWGFGISWRRGETTAPNSGNKVWVLLFDDIHEDEVELGAVDHLPRWDALKRSANPPGQGMLYARNRRVAHRPMPLRKNRNSEIGRIGLLLEP